MKNEKTQYNKFITKLYYKISDIIKPNIFNDYVTFIEKSEREYRKGELYDIELSLTIKQAVKFWACCHIITCKISSTEKEVSIDSGQFDQICGYILYLEYEKELSELFSKSVIKQYKKFDYGELLFPIKWNR